MNFSRSGSGARNNGGLVKSYDLDRTLVVRERERALGPLRGAAGRPETDIQTETNRGPK